MIFEIDAADDEFWTRFALFLITHGLKIRNPPLFGEGHGKSRFGWSREQLACEQGTLPSNHLRNRSQELSDVSDLPGSHPWI